MKKVLSFTFTILLVGYIAHLLYSQHIARVNIQNASATTATTNALDEVSYVSPISIAYLRSLFFEADAPRNVQALDPGSNYSRTIVSYQSEGYTIYGLLTIPQGPMPPGGFPAIVFNHGYIPPQQYQTTEGYIAYVDALARSGFVVFKIDMRGHGQSEGVATGSYFSSAYTIDAIHALKSLQKHPQVNPKRIGMWGHSMAGNLVLRALLTSDEIRAGVIWAGAVYSYEDFAKYRLNDGSYVPRPTTTTQPQPNRETSINIQTLRTSPESVDFQSSFWKSISLTANINYLNAPLQLHHATDDAVVSVRYAQDLAEALEKSDKVYELHTYSTGGHNITSPSFEPAMDRTIAFFSTHLAP